MLTVRFFTCAPLCMMACAALFVCLPLHAESEEVTLFDFTKGVHGWTPNPRVEPLRSTEEGLVVVSTGVDPWVESPVVENFPLDSDVLLTLALKSTADNSGEIFYGAHFQPQDSRSFHIADDGKWQTCTIMIPAQDRPPRLRIDPALGAGTVIISRIEAKALPELPRPAFQKPQSYHVEQDAARTLVAGALEMRHAATAWDRFAIVVDGDEMAQGYDRDQIGYLIGDQARWVELGEARHDLATRDGVLVSQAVVEDADGGTWTLERRFRPDGEGAIAIETTVSVDQDRAVFHLPWLTVFPGLGTFGERKTQALLPGVEYLADEPSSSEADLRGEQAIRRLVESHRICYPMMTVVHQERYLALQWDRGQNPAALFDSPDRVYNSGAHVFALWNPGVGEQRLENALTPYATTKLLANEVWRNDAVLLGGRGETVVAPMQHYVRRSGLPDLPKLEGGFDHAVRLLAHGWLDSECHRDGQWRHAVWGDMFPHVPAADAPAYMRWLAGETEDEGLATRLRNGALEGLAKVPDYHWEQGVSHIQRPLQPLLFGHVEPYIARQIAAAEQLIAQFDDEGILRYTPAPGKPDFAETHWTDHANGFAAVALERILGTATLTGDRDLSAQALDLLDKQTALYANTVPRGAQTWEMPLHTPDIIGSGRLVHNYVLGYLLSGDEEYLDQARYWAWTGLAMVYLDAPTDGEVGLYATTGVIGATNWIAPNWIGLPVQWCGLVYRSALIELAKVDPPHAAMWKQLADGITLAGMQMTWPVSDEARQGLLPDFFHLKPQVSDGPAINPGTVQFHLPEAFDRGRFYDLARLGNGMLVHAPGAITVQDDKTLRIDAWPEQPYYVLLSRVYEEPMGLQFAAEDGSPRPLDIEYDASLAVAILTLEGPGVLKGF